jgi:hypothetical protein
MPVIKAPTVRMGSQVVNEFVDTVGTSNVTYTFPDSDTRDTLSIANISTGTLIVTVNGVETTIEPFASGKINDNYKQFSIRSTLGIAAFRIRCSFDDVDEEDEKGLGNKIDDVRNVLMTVKWYGAIGDGTSRPLSTKYATLAEAQKVYPHATSLNDEIDWCAIQKAINLLSSVRVPYGVYMLNKMLIYRDNVRVEGIAGKSATSFKAVAEWDNVADPAVVKMNGSGTMLWNIISHVYL